MTQTSVHSETGIAQDALRDRCAALGVPTWRFDADGALVRGPSQGGVAGMWLASPVVTRLVTRAARGWLASPAASPSEAMPGCRLIPLVEMERRRVTAVTVAMVLAPQVLTAEQFTAACQSASLDERAVRTSVRALAVHDAGSSDVLPRMLEWLHGDLQELSRVRSNVSAISGQLSESYEEISLLYRLGQSMKELVHPERFVRLACEELHTTLAFSWVAARFRSSDHYTRTLSRRLFVAGDRPCEPRWFDRVTAMLLGEVTAETRIVEAGPLRGGGDATEVAVYPLLRDEGVFGALLAGGKQGDDPNVNNIDMKMLEAAAGLLTVQLENASLYDDQHAMFLGTLGALTGTIDAKDRYTCGHSERVAYLAQALALLHGLSREEAERVRIAGLIHDIGKIGVPESVLCKPGRLTDEEYEQIKKHPEIGHDILRDIPQLEDILPGVLHHHERYDGKGYPHGLTGEAIPTIARIIGLVDAFDAMSSTRTYRPAMPRGRVLEEVRENAGVQFDPRLAEEFLSLDLRVYDQLVARAQAAQSDRFGRRGAA